MSGGMDGSRVLELLRKMLIEEEGEATLARLKYRSKALSTLSEEEILRLAEEDPELVVEERRMYPYDPSSRYFMIRYRGMS